MIFMWLLAAFGAHQTHNQRQCVPLNATIIYGDVRRVLKESSAQKRVEAVTSMTAKWLDRCPVADKGERRKIAESVAPLLREQPLRLPVAIILFQLGDDARGVRDQIHAAYLAQNRSIKYRGTPVITGSDVTTRDSLRCIDIKLTQNRINRRLCRYLIEFGKAKT